MKIVLTCETMKYLSGSPLYNFTLAKELAKEHEVSVVSQWEDNDLKFDLQDAGVKTLEHPEEYYDLAIVSQRRLVPAKKVINVIHSEYDCEKPLPDIEHYVAIRPTIKDVLVNKYGIAPEKITVVYNGVDLERFAPREKEEREYVKVVIPATRDPLREKFLNYYAEKANENYRVFIYGKYFGVDIKKEHVYVFDETPYIEEAIGDADVVAGILLGRVNLEARAMNVKSFIHNPENPEDFEEFYPDREEFESRHDIKNVAKQLLQI